MSLIPKPESRIPNPVPGAHHNGKSEQREVRANPAGVWPAWVLL